MKTPGRKLAAIAAVAAFITSLSGFFMGLLQTSRQAADSRQVAATWSEPTYPSHTEFPEAPTYAELPHHRLQPNHDWQPRTSQLPLVDQGIDGTTLILSVLEQRQLRAARAERRAFDGAPPIAPHPVDQMSSAACLACHGNPVRVGQLVVPQISHPSHYSQCLQCHASGAGPTSTWEGLPPPVEGIDLATLAATNTFPGHREAAPGERAFDSAPAVIPHTTWMRENCMSCHGPGGSSALRTSHPSRQSCTQCHPLNPALEQRPASLEPFLAATP